MFLRHKRPAGSERDDSVRPPLIGVGVKINLGCLRRCIAQTHAIGVMYKQCSSSLSSTESYKIYQNMIQQLHTCSGKIVMDRKKQNETCLVAIGQGS